VAKKKTKKTSIKRWWSLKWSMERMRTMIDCWQSLPEAASSKMPSKSIHSPNRLRKNGQLVSARRKRNWIGGQSAWSLRRR
jgi:hypothetical protein